MQCEEAQIRVAARTDRERDIAEVNMRTVCVRNEVDEWQGKWKRRREDWRRLEEKRRENEVRKAGQRKELDLEEARKQAALHKEIAFYEDQISFISSRQQLLIQEVQKAEWRVKTLAAEEKESNEEEQNMLNQLLEAEKRAKLTVDVRKLKEIVCGKCLERVENARLEDGGTQLSLPIAVSNSREEANSKSICEIS